ncbi:MAG: YdeI/OmpD-associated family protein [Pyrinomonadaceae bacterium]|nr:YdeI/OmpD-associated family protein [Pyrinomonadaceae bacterium]
MSKIDDLNDFQPLSRQEWRDWLTENHAEPQGIWLVYFKKSSGKPRVNYDEAVEEALCFGWIDSLPRKIDDERAKLLFTPRKPKSVWSQLNKTRIERLIERGLMTEIGFAKIAAAKKDGSWNALDASDNLEIAEDLANAFDENHEARKNFDAFSNSVKKAILQWLNSSKQTETRKKRIVKLVAMAANNKRVNFDKE